MNCLAAKSVRNYKKSPRRLIMMNNSINAVQRQYMFAVNPVQLFETKNSPVASKNSFDFINQKSPNSFNPFHPNVQNSTTANKLDILS